MLTTNYSRCEFLLVQLDGSFLLERSTSSFERTIQKGHHGECDADACVEVHSTILISCFGIIADFLKNCLFSCSTEEAGKYLELYKIYENKPADMIQNHVEGDYMSKVEIDLRLFKYYLVDLN